MIDLHCHMLPGIDDGAGDLAVAVAMAQAAVADGIRVTACTPHIYPGLYENDAGGIRRALAALRTELARRGIPLALVQGADVHLVPEVLDGLRRGRIPTLNGTRYLLLEPPHHVAPPRFEDAVFALAAAGYVPVITHPERLSWIENHYEVFVRLARRGVWMQVTAGSVTGRFGRRPRYWAERLLDEGWVHILATDAHGVAKRPPLLAEAREAAALRVGAEEAEALVLQRPKGVIDNVDPAGLKPVPGAGAALPPPSRGQRWFGQARRGP